MPCRGPEEDDPTVDPRRLRILENCEAVLCAVLTRVEEQVRAGTVKRSTDIFQHSVMKHIDWEEVGVKRTVFEEWWDAHKRNDKQRRKIEENNAKVERARQKALKKLTKAERKLLKLDTAEVESEEEDEA